VQTKHLTLVPKSLQDVHAMIDAMSPSEKAQLSADWLAQLHASTHADPWVFGFSVVHSGAGLRIGHCGFKGPPSGDGVVEIAYGINHAHRLKGYATEAAGALTSYAFADARVRVVCAHTLPEPNASTRVLTKCGFRYIGEVIDPEDGLVWRWEKNREAGA
jgi:RimJ/RimL family protein N-acetyltransferase